MNLPRIFKNNIITRPYKNWADIGREADKLREKHRKGFLEQWQKRIDKRETDIDYNWYRKRKEREFFDAMTTAYDARLEGKRIRNYKDLARMEQWANVVPNPALPGYDEAQDEDRGVREEEERLGRELRDRIREEHDNLIDTIISNYTIQQPQRAGLSEEEAQTLIELNNSVDDLDLIVYAYTNGYDAALALAHARARASDGSGGRRTRRRRQKKNRRSRDSRRKRKKTSITHRHKKNRRSRDNRRKRKKTSRMPRR